MRITAITMTAIRMAGEVEGAPLLRLLAWLSPSFPVGAFSYSHGLERAVAEGLVADPAGLADWLRQLVEFGSGWNDAVLFAESWRRARSGGDMADLAELGAALAGTRERHMEAMLQGAAFLKAAASWPHAALDRLPADCPYCVAVGAVSGAHGLPLDAALAAFLQAFSGNLIQAGIRLSLLGQTDAVAALAALEPVTLAVAARAAKSSLDDLGSATLLSEVMAMRHETQHSRLFRS